MFAGDPAANTRLKVEVLGEATAGDTPTLVLVTPWTLNGLAFPPDDRFPDSLTIGKRSYPVFHNEIDALGSYYSVNLMGDVSMLKSPESARAVGSQLGAPFRVAVEKAREALAVPDEARRELFKWLRPELPTS